MAILQTVPILNESVNFISLSHKDVAKNVIALCLEQVATSYKCDDLSQVWYPHKGYSNCIMFGFKPLYKFSLFLSLFLCVTLNLMQFWKLRIIISSIIHVGKAEKSTIYRRFKIVNEVWGEHVKTNHLKKRHFCFSISWIEICNRMFIQVVTQNYKIELVIDR